MGINLKWKHQQKTFELLKEALKENKRAAYVFPTGAGKTFPVLKYMEENPDKTTLIVVPTRGILRQYKNYIKQYFDNGENLLKNKNISIVTYKKLSLINRLSENISPNLIVFDEAHRIGAQTWEPAADMLMKNNPEAEVIATTATPERTDGRNMLNDKFKDNIVYEMSLIDSLNGEKENEVVFGSPRYVKVLSVFKEILEEYKEKIDNTEDEQVRAILYKKYEKAEKIISSAPGLEDIITQGMTEKNGKYIVFCKDRDDLQEKMRNAKDIFGKVNSNIKMDYVLSSNGVNDTLGKTQTKNSKTIQEFENRPKDDSLQLMFCVDMLDEGVHIESIDGEVMFKPIKSSKILYKQEIGRIMYAGMPDGKNVVIDAVGNWIYQKEAYKEFIEAIQNRKERENDKEESEKEESNKEENESHNQKNLLQLIPEELELLEVLEEIEGVFSKKGEIAKLIKNLEILRKNGVDTEKIQKTINRKEIKLSEIVQDGIDINKIIEENDLSGEYPIGSKMHYAVRLCNQGPNHLITEEQIEKLIEFGITSRVKIERAQKDETIATELLRHLDILKQNGVDLSKIRKSEGSLLKNITQDGIDIEEIIKQNGLDGNYKIGSKIQYISRLIKEQRYNSITEEEKAAFFEHGVIYEEKNMIDKYIMWVEEHKDEKTNEFKYPRSHISNGQGGFKKLEERTDDEEAEREVGSWWNNRPVERDIVEKYIGIELDEIPEEEREIVRKLRKIGIGDKIVKTRFEQYIDWIKEHKDEKTGVYTYPKQIQDRKVGEMNPEEYIEHSLAAWWTVNSLERKIFNQYKDCDEKEFEALSEDVKNIIEICRSVKIREKQSAKSVRLNNARELRRKLIETREITSLNGNSENEEEKRMAQMFSRISSYMIKPYLELRSEEEKKEYLKNNPDLPELIEINRDVRIFLSERLKKARPLKEWFLNNNRIPNVKSSNDEERKVGNGLIDLRSTVKEFMRITDPVEKDLYLMRFPETYEVMEIVSDIDLNMKRVNSREFGKQVKEYLRKNVYKHVDSNQEIREELAKRVRETKNNEHERKEEIDD